MTSVAARAATVADARQHARQRLESTSLSPGADADCLLAAATGLNPVVFRSHPETLLEPAARTAFEAMIERRMAARRPGFEAHRRRVSILIPWPPKR